MQCINHQQFLTGTRKKKQKQNFDFHQSVWSMPTLSSGSLLLFFYSCIPTIYICLVIHSIRNAHVNFKISFEKKENKRNTKRLFCFYIRLYFVVGTVHHILLINFMLAFFVFVNGRLCFVFFSSFTLVAVRLLNNSFLCFVR